MKSSPFRNVSFFAALGLALFSPALRAETGSPVLRGVLVTGSEKLFSLAIPGSAPAWVEVGKSFEGWKVEEFSDADNTLRITREGVTKNLLLADSVIGESPVAGTSATLADAENLLTQMRFDEMMTKTIEQQKDATVNMMSQMFKGKDGASPEGSADLEAFQRKTMDVMFEAMDLPGMKKDVAKIYSEVFTKEEMRAQADFYTTAGGKAMLDKQPAVQEKMMAVMGPRMMAAMPKVQAMAMEFGKEQVAKRKAAKEAAQGAAETPATSPAASPATAPAVK